MKLIRLFGIIILICLVWGLGSAFNGEDYKPVDETIEETSNLENTVSFSSTIEKEIEEESTKVVDNDYSEENNSDVSTNVVDKTSTTSSINNSVENSSVKQKEEQIIVPKNEKVEQKTEVKETPEETVVDIQTQIITESNEVEETPEIIEEIKEEVDNELEKLKKQVEYSTYDECMNIGFEEAIKDPIGILGFSCPYIAYEGKIIGYRLQLDYTNPMEN